jgi:hypothetical protein
VSEQFPINAPEGRHFYLAHGTGNKKKYFHASVSGGKGGTPRLTFTHDRHRAMKFTNRELALSFLAFVNNGILFPHGLTYELVLEPVGYVTERLSTKMELTNCIA